MATNRRCQTNAPPSLVISMAMRIRRYDAERIAQYGRSRATLDATICRHRSSIRPVSPRRTRSRHAIPRPFQPKPRRPTFDCRVVHDCDRADCSMAAVERCTCAVPHTGSVALLPPGSVCRRRDDIERTVCYPSPCRKINPKSPLKNEAATPCPGRFSPNPVVLRLIVMFSAIATRRIVRFRPPG